MNPKDNLWLKKLNLEPHLEALKIKYQSSQISTQEFENELSKLLENIEIPTDLIADFLDYFDSLIDSNEVSDDQKTIILGNGDINTRLEATEKSSELGLDGYMIGRGIFGNPFLFNPNFETKAGNIWNIKNQSFVNKEQRIGLFFEHILLWQKTWGSTKNFAVLKKYSKIYIQGFDGAVDLRSQIASTKSLDELCVLVKSWVSG